MNKIFLLFPILFLACKESVEKTSTSKIDDGVNDSLVNEELRREVKKEYQEQILIERIDSIFWVNDLVDIKSVNTEIKVDVKYATTDNFMRVKLYDTISKIYLNVEVANRLSACQYFLDSIRPGYSLLVYDGVRPLQVQTEMWNALDSIPVNQRGKFVSNPVRGSVHNYGAAVDLTIVDSSGNILDMGAGYDEFNKIAFPSLESKFLQTGELTIQQWENRKLLRKVMRKEGFRNIPSEWWHFNAYSRVTSSRKFKRVLNESGDADWKRLEYPKKDTIKE